MKITKARLKEIIKEELQSEVIGTFFAAKAKKAKKEADKKKKEKKSNLTQQEPSDKKLKEGPDFTDMQNLARQIGKAKAKAEKDPSFLQKLLAKLAELAKELQEAELRIVDDCEDGEGKMADSQLNRIADLAVMIDEMVDDDTNLPEWVESKITKAQDYMSAVMNYMKGEMADAQEEMMREEEERETTPAQRKKIKDRAEKIKPSTIKQYGEEEGTSAAFGIATDQVLGET